MEDPIVNEPAEDVRPEVEQFANALDDCLSPLLTLAEKKTRLLRLPQIYHQNALRRLEDLEADIAAGGAEDIDMDADDVDIEIEPPQPTADEAAEIERIQREAQTWDLLRRILPLRHTSARSNAFDDPPLDLWHEFLQEDPIAKERHAILQWLQTNANTGPDIDKLVQDLQQNADRGDVIAHGWLHTRSAIKLRKSVTAWPHLLDRQSPSVTQSHVNTDGALMVTQLDPDAPTRQARKLEPQDEYFERAIWLGCFEHLRRGSSLDTIRDWCQERTEMWRAMSMSAMPLSRDENGHTVVDSEPSSLGLWRRMCYSLARQGGSDDYERAVYGLLSGDVISVEKVCRTWDDFLFANYNALLRTQLDNFILGKCSPEEAADLTQSFSSFDAIQYLGDEGSIEKRLVSSLESKKGIGNQASEPAKALQAAVISKKIHQHLHEQGVAMSKEANDSAPSSLMPLASPADVRQASQFFTLNQRSGLRLVAHIYVLVTLLERLDKDNKGPLERMRQVDGSWAEDNILAGYTEYLWRSGLAELIPLYCSVLESPRREEVLGCSFIEEDDPSRRRQLRKLIEKSGINTVTYVKAQADIMFKQLDLSKHASPFRSGFRILMDGPPTAHHGRTVNADFFGDEDALDPKHINVVRSLEWLLLEQSVWPLAFSYAVKVYKFFLSMCYLAYHSNAPLPSIRNANDTSRKHASQCGKVFDRESQLREDYARLVPCGWGG
jgi:nuclear pore complex protein Nup107